MKLKHIVSVLAASTLSLGFAAVLNTPTQAASDYSFACVKANDGVWTTVFKSSRREGNFIRWTSDFGSAADYTRKQRCLEVSNRLNSYVQQGQFYLTHGKHKENNYPIICRTDGEGKGCKGLVYTLDPNSRQKPAQVLKELLELVGSDFTKTPVTATSCPLYVNVKSFIQGSSPAAKYVCSSR
ncbi:MAG: hypothetical protein F6K61_16085 [Sphaerospermopsis sp. SIO1G1]|nr:hypothetical protein [Sphaerospermopsis sp. SIO1G1]